MKFHKRSVFALVMMITLLFCAVPSVIAGNGLDAQIVCPPITSGVSFNLSLWIYNKHNKPITFNKIAVAYVNPDMTVKGPYEVSTTSYTVPANNYINVPVPFIIQTTQPSGSLVPVFVTFWFNNYTGGYDRGGGMMAAKVK